MDATPHDLRTRVLDRLKAELGPPNRSGDGCRWTVSDTSGIPVLRITVFVDGPDSVVDGWLSVASNIKAERLRIASVADLDAFIARCRTPRATVPVAPSS